MKTIREFAMIIGIGIALAVLSGCGKQEVVAPPTYLPATTFAPNASRYPYYYTLICNDKLTTMTITSSAQEPVNCPK